MKKSGNGTKKMIIFLSIIIALFVLLGVVTNLQKEDKVADSNNPYGKKDLKEETIEQLDDPNYQNLILPGELEKKLKSDKDVTVYFYSPICPHCKKATPVVAPLAEKMGIDLVQYNVYEFDQGWDDYHIESTPTIVHFVNGKEEARIVGYNEEETFKEWFEEHKVN